VDIDPTTVSMSGAPGDVLSAEVIITPSEKYQFSILELKQKFNTDIQAELVKPEGKNTAWKVKIQSTLQKADDIYDIITLNTDSKYKPRLKIRVFAVYLETKDTNS